MSRRLIYVVLIFVCFAASPLSADTTADVNQPAVSQRWAIVDGFLKLLRDRYAYKLLSQDDFKAMNEDVAHKTLQEANLAIDKISDIPPATTMPSTRVPDTDLLNATRAFEADRRAANEKLEAAYDAAIKSAQNRRDAGTVVALQRQRDLILRDGIMLKVEDGWTILFRSANPFLFNTPVSNAKSYSVPMYMAPAGMKYLRFRRMDTGDYVIVPLTNDQILANGPLSQSYWWRGDKVIDNQSSELGITDQRATSSSNGIMAMEPDGNRTGWGFARTIAGERQAWVWAGVELDPTSFEIAVTTRELSAEEQSHVLE